MLKIAEPAYKIFNSVIEKYHVLDSIEQDYPGDFPKDAPFSLFYQKCWIDTIQWHVEDLVRAQNIQPEKALSYKRLIDKLNQERTDLVEKIDDYFVIFFKDIQTKTEAKINTESPAWAIDRLSILSLKIYHMNIEATRKEIDEIKKNLCQKKLELLRVQMKDLSTSIDELLEDIASGNKKMHVYRQHKMYNDPELNPVLYNSNNK
jgi:hypothetical protein